MLCSRLLCSVVLVLCLFLLPDKQERSHVPRKERPDSSVVKDIDRPDTPEQLYGIDGFSHITVAGALAHELKEVSNTNALNLG